MTPEHLTQELRRLDGTTSHDDWTDRSSITSHIADVDDEKLQAALEYADRVSTVEEWLVEYNPFTYEDEEFKERNPDSAARIEKLFGAVIWSGSYV